MLDTNSLRSGCLSCPESGAISNANFSSKDYKDPLQMANSFDHFDKSPKLRVGVKLKSDDNSVLEVAEGREQWRSEVFVFSLSNTRTRI